MNRKILHEIMIGVYFFAVMQMQQIFSMQNTHYIARILCVQIEYLFLLVK